MIHTRAPDGASQRLQRTGIMDNGDGDGDGDDLGDGDDDDYDLPPFSSAASVFPSSCGWQPFNAAIFPPGGTG